MAAGDGGAGEAAAEDLVEPWVGLVGVGLVFLEGLGVELVGAPCVGGDAEFADGDGDGLDGVGQDGIDAEVAQGAVKGGVVGMLVADGEPEVGVDAVADALRDLDELLRVAAGIGADLVAKWDDVGLDAGEEAGVVGGELDQ